MHQSRTLNFTRQPVRIPQQQPPRVVPPPPPEDSTPEPDPA